MFGIGSQMPSKNVDIVFCIDGTGSMTPCIDNVRDNALKFYNELVAEVGRLGNAITSVRVKVIIFRDYKSDDDAMEQSRFFELPDDDAEFSNFMASIDAHGGCGEDANGFEAMYLAMKSDWTQGNRDRQVIVTFADTDAIKLGKRREYPGYPRDMVDMDGFIYTWEGVQGYESKLIERCKRAVIFAPAGSNYEGLVQQMRRVTFQPVDPGCGMADISFDAIIKQIAASVSSR